MDSLIELMGRSGSWLLSAVIHGAMLIGAIIPVLASSVEIEHGSRSFVCSIRESTWRVDRIDRRADVFTQQRPELAPAVIDDDLFSLYSKSGGLRPGCGPCHEELMTGTP